MSEELWTPCVVIVDDAPVNLTLMEVLMKRIESCQVVKFADPVAGIDWCGDNKVDLLIVDFMMPGLDGNEFISRFRAMPRHEDVPILMITADHTNEIRYRALEVGANDFLTKPIDRPEFNSRVKNNIALRRNHVMLADRASWLAAEVRATTEHIRAREREMVARLARAAEFRDPETGAHILRMAHYSCLIARRLGWRDDELDMLLEAAPMHDIGKVGTPDAILLKPGKLTPGEFEVMKQHAAMGWEILRGSDSPVVQLAAEIAHAHHEKFDGSGYPRGLAGEAIPHSGRIVAVADVFDALTSPRPYKPAWDVARALAFLQEGAGSHFDPACVEAFLAGVDEMHAIRARYTDDTPVGFDPSRN